MKVVSPLIKRFGLLSGIQFINFIFPFTIYFLLIYRISIQQIGEISSWQMIFLILATISNYNFPLTLISISEKLKQSPKTVATLWNKILEFRYIFTIIIFSIVLITYSFLPLIALYSIFILLGKLYNPSQLLLVLSRNNTFLTYNFVTKLVPLILIFFFINERTWLWTNFIIGISELLISVLFILRLKWNVFFGFRGFKKGIKYLKKERKSFYTQVLNTLIVLITVPFTHLFFGSYVAGIISVIEKIISFVRALSGNLFYALLPNFDNFNNPSIGKISKKTHIISLYLALMVFGTIVLLVFIFSELISQKIIDKTIIKYLIISSFASFPIIMSTPFQIVYFKFNQIAKIYLYAKIQLATLVFGILLLGNLFGIIGVILAIVLQEFVCYFLYRIKLPYSTLKMVAPK